MKIIPCKNINEFNALEAKVHRALKKLDKEYAKHSSCWCEPGIVNSITGEIAFIVEKSPAKDAGILIKLTNNEKGKIIDIQPNDINWYPQL